MRSISLLLLGLSVFLLFGIGSSQDAEIITDLNLNITLLPGERKVFRYDPPVRTLAIAYNITTNGTGYADRGVYLSCFDIRENVIYGSTKYVSTARCGSPLQKTTNPYWYLTISLGERSKIETFFVKLFPLAHLTATPGVTYETPMNENLTMAGFTTQYHAIVLPASLNFLGYYIYTNRNDGGTSFAAGRVRTSLQAPVYEELIDSTMLYFPRIDKAVGVTMKKGNTDWIFLLSYKVPFNFTFVGISDAEVPAWSPNQVYTFTSADGDKLIPFRIQGSSEYAIYNITRDYGGADPICLINVADLAYPSGFIVRDEDVLCLLNPNSMATTQKFSFSVIPTVLLTPRQAFNFTCPGGQLSNGALNLKSTLYKVAAVPGKRTYFHTIPEVKFTGARDTWVTVKGAYSFFDSDQGDKYLYYYNCYNRNGSLLFEWMDPVTTLAPGDNVVPITRERVFFEIAAQSKPYTFGLIGHLRCMMKLLTFTSTTCL